MTVALPTFAATATLTQRESTSHIQLTAGYGTSRIDYFGSSASPLDLQDPSAVLVRGNESGEMASGIYQTTFAASWEQQQDFSFQTLGNDAVLQASGSLAVSMGSSWFNSVGGLGGSPATQYYTSTNSQAFEFELDQAVAFTFIGATVDNQRLEMFRWSGTDWITAAYAISPGAGASFSNSGQIDAGRYLLRNSPAPVFRAQTAVTGNGWDYTLTLLNTVAAVPEPATMVSMLAGLGLLGWHMGSQARRRRVS